MRALWMTLATFATLASTTPLSAQEVKRSPSHVPTPPISQKGIPTPPDGRWYCFTGTVTSTYVFGNGSGSAYLEFMLNSGVQGREATFMAGDVSLAAWPGHVSAVLMGHATGRPLSVYYGVPLEKGTPSVVATMLGYAPDNCVDESHPLPR